MNIAEIKLFLQENTFGFEYSTLTSKFFISTILNLQSQDIIINLGSGWEESYFNFTTFPCWYFIPLWVRNKDFTRVLPAKLGWRISVVCHHDLLSEEHFDAVVGELEL